MTPSTTRPPTPPAIDPRDEAWLLARERGEAMSPPSADTERAYRRLERALAELPLDAGRDESDWQARVLAALPGEAAVVPITRARRHPAVRWTLLAAPALAAAAAVAILLWPDRQPEIEVAVRRGAAAVRGGDDARVGDALRATGRVGAGELRIYRSDHALVRRCPGDSGCVASGAGADRSWSIELPLEAPGRYRVVRLIGIGAAPTGSFDGDLAAAQRAGATIAAESPVDVQ